MIMNNIRKFEDFLDKMQGLIDNAKKQGHVIVPIEDIENTFPELKGSEDERHRKWILEYLYDGLRKSDEQFKDQFKCAIDWLEKQKEIDKSSYEIAEKEKYDFVSGQFIECRKSFNEFKENNSYWFEYVGNDTYIGRSDNILNKKFHITPRQLYRLFTQQHCPKENNINEETNAPTGYGKYVNECLHEAAKHFFSEGEDKYPVADLFYAGVRCGRSWLEKQSEKKSTDNLTQQEVMDIAVAKCFNEQETVDKVEPKFKVGDTMRTLQEANDGYTDGMPVVISIDNEYYHCTNELIAIKDQDDYEFPPINVKQKNIDNVEPKFKVGDWIVNNNSGGVCQVTEIRDDEYCLWPLDAEIMGYLRIIDIDNDYHLWTIQDAKNGNILSYENEVFIVKKSANLNILYYCCYDGEHFIIDSFYSLTIDDINNIRPATKEQRDLLFQKMKENGYEWDADKKELKKIDNHATWSEDDEKMFVGLTTIVEGWYNSQSEKEKEYYGDCGYSNWLQSLKDRVQPQPKKQWSKEDSFRTETLSSIIKSGGSIKPELRDEWVNWLKSLKQRVVWQPSDEQMEALESAMENCAYSEYQDCLKELIVQLKKL